MNNTKCNVGIIGASDIAYNRFLPAIKKNQHINVVAVAEEYDVRRLDRFCIDSSLEPMTSYADLINREDIDAVYIPQPPAFHYMWAKAALVAGKHVLVEKPSTVCFDHSADLVECARRNGLALHENYMFQYHCQLARIKEIIDNKRIGEIRGYRALFGFPKRSDNDFRYSKTLGGGALLDAGGYPIRLASIFLGNSIKTDSARLGYKEGIDVDLFGSAQFSNDDGISFQIGFGMDNAYQCSFEAWGSEGILRTDRIFTAPEGFETVAKIVDSSGETEVKLGSDSHFSRSVDEFIREIEDGMLREKMYEQILIQSRLVDDVLKKGAR